MLGLHNKTYLSFNYGVQKVISAVIPLTRIWSLGANCVCIEAGPATCYIYMHKYKHMYICTYGMQRYIHMFV